MVFLKDLSKNIIKNHLDDISLILIVLLYIRQSSPDKMIYLLLQFIIFIIIFIKSSIDFRFFIYSLILILSYQLYFTTLIALPPKQKSRKDPKKYDMILGMWEIPPSKQYEYPDLTKEVIPSLIIDK